MKRLLNLYGVCSVVALFIILVLLLDQVENGIIFLGGMILIIPPFLVTLIKFLDNLVP